MLDSVSRWLRRYQGIESNQVYRLAVDVASGRRTLERALLAVQSYQVTAKLADGDLLDMDQIVEQAAATDLRFARILAALNAEAARVKSFEKVMVDLLLRCAELARMDGDIRAQETASRLALDTARGIVYVAGQRRALNLLARIALDMGDTAEAQELLHEQLTTGREEADTREDVRTAMLLGDIALQDSDSATALAFYQRAARSARRLQYWKRTVNALLNQVTIVRERNDVDTALTLLYDAASAASQTDDIGLQAQVAFRTGSLLRDMHQSAEAIGFLNAALERARVLGDDVLAANCVSMLAPLETQMGQLDHAMQHWQDAVELHRQAGNSLEVAQAQFAIGEHEMKQDRPSAALPALAEAREIAAQANDEDMLSEASGLLGVALATLGHDRDALDRLLEAARASRALNEFEDEARWLIAAAEVTLRTSAPTDATPLADRAAALARGTRDHALLAQIHSVQGQIALAEDRRGDAEDSFANAVAAARAAGYTGEALRYIPVMARLAAEAGDATRAIGYLDSAVHDAEAMSDVMRIGALHAQAARILMAARRTDEARERYGQSISAARAADDQRGLGRALLSLAVIEHENNPEMAVECYYQAIDASTAGHDPRNVAMAHLNLGLLLADLHHDHEARTHLTRARSAAEALRDHAMAQRASEILETLAPASLSWGRYGDGIDGADDMSIAEEPVRPRTEPTIH